MVKVSVIVPVYNMEKYLGECLSSLARQTFNDYEVIVINDGSTDSSEEIITYYKKEYPKIFKAYSFKNQGISKTRNIGIEKANGEYLTFIDSDDYVEKTFIEEMYNKISVTDSDICVCDYYTVNEKNDVREVFLDDFSLSSVKDNPQLLFIINSSPWNKLYKKSLFNYLRFETIKYEDLLLIPKLVLNSNKIVKLNKCLNYYRIRGNSETTTMDERVFDIIKILDNLNNYFKSKKVFDKFYSEIEYFNIYRTTMYILQQKNQKNIYNRDRFIDLAYKHLDDNFPNWRKNKYYKERRSFFKRLIERNRFLSKTYVKIFSR